MGCMRLVEDNRDVVSLEGELIKFCIVAGLSYAAAPVLFPVGTNLVDKHMHFMGALILLMVLEGDRDTSPRCCCWDCCRLVWDCRAFWDLGLLRGIDAPSTYLAIKKNNFVLFSISAFETLGRGEIGNFLPSSSLSH